MYRVSHRGKRQLTIIVTESRLFVSGIAALPPVHELSDSAAVF
jgi:hypothetical protein